MEWSYVKVIVLLGLISCDSRSKDSVIIESKQKSIILKSDKNDSDSVNLLDVIKANKSEGKLIKPTKHDIPSLINTLWICELTPTCLNKYFFYKNGEFKYESCEHETTTVGSYEVKDSVLVLLNDETTGNVELKNQKVRYSYAYLGEYMVMTYREVLEDDNWRTTYDRFKRTSAYGEECQFYLR